MSLPFRAGQVLAIQFRGQSVYLLLVLASSCAAVTFWVISTGFLRSAITTLFSPGRPIQHSRGTGAAGSSGAWDGWIGETCSAFLGAGIYLSAWF